MTSKPTASRGFSLQGIFNSAGIGIALLVLVVFFSVYTEHFLTAANLTNILTQVTINLALAVEIGRAHV